MAQAVPARLEAHFEIDRHSDAGTVRAATTGKGACDIRLAVFESLTEIEKDWRAFEQRADCTVFQTFAWVATWQRHIGTLDGVRPAIVVGRDLAGKIQFILPLAVRTAGFARALEWLGSDLCDYNGPLLAPEFSGRIDRAGFLTLWDDVKLVIQGRPDLQFDVVRLQKMPALIGTQPNPMLALGVIPNASGAYLTRLEGDWQTFYAAKRSSTTRRRDRTKRKRLGELGDVRLCNPAGDNEVRDTLDTLMEQKSRSFARMGVANLFARPGHADFYRALATEPASKDIVHVSRLDVGAIMAAVNLGLIHRDRYYHLLASYDDGEVSRFGPGAAHLHDLLQEAIGRGLRIFDFTIGDERYKRDWCDTELTLYDHIAAATWRGAAVAMPMLVGQRLKRWIKQTPLVWDAFSRSRALIGSLVRLARR